MKKLFLTVLMSLIACAAFSQDVAFNIVKNDGTTTSHIMSTDTRIYYTDTQLLFNDNGTTVTYNLSELRKAYFTTPLSTEEIDSQQLAIYPNPAKDVLNINNLEDNQEVTIYSISGAVMKKVTASGDATIDISELRPGMYVVNAGNLFSKFIKM